jgi:chemotaxis signal transduction protein
MRITLDKVGSNIYEGKKSYPPLEEIIFKIDQQIDKCPHPYGLEGFETFLGNQLGGFKRRGRQYICFYLHNTQFAFPLQHTLEITHRPEIIPLPNLPDWVLGICNIRGEILSVVDIAQIIGVTQQEAVQGTHLILIRSKDVTTSILADGIAGSFFDQDPNQQIEKRVPENQMPARFVSTILAINQQDIHLLKVPELMSAIVISGL